MYNYLLSIKRLHFVWKIVISIFLFLLFGPIGIIISFALIIKSEDTNPKKFDKTIQILNSYYDILRPYAEDSEETIIYVGNYACEYEKNISFSSNYISIYAKNLPGSVKDAIDFVEQRKIKNDIYYQLGIKQKYSKTAKTTIILATLEYIRENYPNDKILLDKSIPLGTSILNANKTFIFVQTDFEKNTSKANDIDYEYVSKYGPNYEYIFSHIGEITRQVAHYNVPKYAMDWLAESIQKEKQIDLTAIVSSAEKGLPYLCETEEELSLFEEKENPLLDSVDGIYYVLLHYKYGNSTNEHKFNYWLNHLLLLVQNGDMMAQGIICWKCCNILPDGKYDGVLPQKTWNDIKQCYQDKLIESCNAGNPYAQLAVAKYYKTATDEQKEMLYIAAIKNGLSDACYYYAQYLNLRRYIANGMKITEPLYGTPEWQEYMHDELALYRKGAELDNGVMAGYCQYRLGDMYASGDGGLFKDVATAQMWFKKAYNNGYKGAKFRIEE